MGKVKEENKAIGIKRKEDILTLSKLSKTWTNKDNAKMFWKEKLEQYIPDDEKESIKKEYYEIIERL